MMGALRRGLIGVAASGAAAAMVFPLMEGGNQAPNPTVEQATEWLDSGEDYLDEAIQRRSEVVGIIGQTCADAAYPGTVNQPLAHLSSEEHAAVLISEERAPCGDDLEAAEIKVDLLREAFSEAEQARVGVEDDKARLTEAEDWQKADLLGAELLNAGWVAGIGLLATGVAVGLARNKGDSTEVEPY